MFFAVNTSTFYTRLPQKKLHDVTIFFVTGIDRQKKNYTDCNKHHSDSIFWVPWGCSVCWWHGQPRFRHTLLSRSLLLCRRANGIIHQKFVADQNPEPILVQLQSQNIWSHEAQINNARHAMHASQPPNRRRNPNKSANKSADRFFAKTGSQSPGSQSQGPNTPSFWLLRCWSHVVTQIMSQFKKKIRLSVYTWSLSNSVAVRGGGLVIYTQEFRAAGLGSIPTGYGPEFFLHFLSPVLLRKSVFHAQTRRRSVHTDWPFASPHVLGRCAALICNQIFGMYMIPVQYYGSARQWSSGICPGHAVGKCGFNSWADFFFIFGHLSC